MFELYAIPLTTHHEAGLFGYDVARRHGDAAVERWIAASSPQSPPNADRTPEPPPWQRPPPKLARPFALRCVSLRCAWASVSSECSIRRATLRAAGKLFSTPFGSSRARALAAPVGDARIGEITVDGKRIATYTWGDPQRQPYVLFAHGWSSHGTRFLPWVPRLRARRLCGRRLRSTGARTQRRRTHQPARLRRHAARRRQAFRSGRRCSSGIRSAVRRRASRSRTGCRPIASC